MGRVWLQENGLQGMRPLLTAFLRSRADSVSCRRPGLAEAWGGAGPRPAPGAPRRRKLGRNRRPRTLARHVRGPEAGSRTRLARAAALLQLCSLCGGNKRMPASCRASLPTRSGHSRRRPKTASSLTALSQAHHSGPRCPATVPTPRPPLATGLGGWPSCLQTAAACMAGTLTRPG